MKIVLSFQEFQGFPGGSLGFPRVSKGLQGSLGTTMGSPGFLGFPLGCQGFPRVAGGF